MCVTITIRNSVEVAEAITKAEEIGVKYIIHDNECLGSTDDYDVLRAFWREDWRVVSVKKSECGTKIVKYAKNNS